MLASALCSLGRHTRKLTADYCTGTELAAHCCTWPGTSGGSVCTEKETTSTERHTSYDICRAQAERSCVQVRRGKRLHAADAATKCQWCYWLSVTANHVTGGIRGVSLGPFPQLVLVLEQLAAGALGPAGQHAHDDLQGGQVRGRNVWRTCVE